MNEMLLLARYIRRKNTRGKDDEKTPSSQNPNRLSRLLRRRIKEQSRG